MELETELIRFVKLIHTRKSYIVATRHLSRTGLFIVAKILGVV